MDFISGQKKPSYHKNDLFDDLPDRKTAISFSLGQIVWVALSLNGEVLGENSIRRNPLEVKPSLGMKTESHTRE